MLQRTPKCSPPNTPQKKFCINYLATQYLKGALAHAQTRRLRTGQPPKKNRIMESPSHRRKTALSDAKNASRLVDWTAPGPDEAPLSTGTALNPQVESWVKREFNEYKQNRESLISQIKESAMDAAVERTENIYAKYEQKYYRQLDRPVQNYIKLERARANFEKVQQARRDMAETLARDEIEILMPNKSQAGLKYQFDEMSPMQFIQIVERRTEELMKTHPGFTMPERDTKRYVDKILREGYPIVYVNPETDLLVGNRDEDGKFTGTPTIDPFSPDITKDQVEKNYAKLEGTVNFSWPELPSMLYAIVNSVLYQKFEEDVDAKRRKAMEEKEKAKKFKDRMKPKPRGGKTPEPGGKNRKFWKKTRDLAFMTPEEKEREKQRTAELKAKRAKAEARALRRAKRAAKPLPALSAVGVAETQRENWGVVESDGSDSESDSESDVDEEWLHGRGIATFFN